MIFSRFFATGHFPKKTKHLSFFSMQETLFQFMMKSMKITKYILRLMKMDDSN